MSGEENLDHVFGWNRYTMKFIGIWPEDRNFRRLSSYKAMIAILTMLCFTCLPQSADLPFVWGDFDLVVENLSMANASITVALIKTVIFWSNAKHLQTLVLCMKKDWDTIVDKRDRKMMLETAKFAKNLSTGCLILAEVVVVMYLTLRLSTSDDGRQTFLRVSYFPYNTTSSPSYELTYFGQFMSALYAANSYTAVDTFITTLVLHTCAQLSNLSRELTKLNSCTKAEFQIKLTNIARRHEYLNRFAETIEDNFNMMLLIQMLGCTLQLCFQCLQAFISLLDEMNEIAVFQFMFLVIYTIFILLQLYLYCYIGERLLVESTEIANAAFNCSWYNLSAYEARSLMIIIRRARSPLHITAGRFCSFNLELYSEVLKRTVAYMSFFYAMKF